MLSSPVSMNSAKSASGGDLTDIPGIGDKTASALAKVGITTFSELLETYPRTYRAYTASSANISRVGDWVVLKGHLTRPISRRTARVTTQLSTFQDHSGRLQLRWFNLPYLARSVNPNTTYLVKGQVQSFRGVKQIVSPQLTKTDEDQALVDQLVPIYSHRGTLKPWIFRQKLSQALASTNLPPDPLPKNVIDQYQLLSYQDALQTIHHPDNHDQLEQAIYRLSFQELYYLQLNSLQARTSKPTLSTRLFPQTDNLAPFINSLPFTLTSSQSAAIDSIADDLSSAHPMHRLLAGEVGSGKTVVAAAAAALTHSAGFRTLVMAPTVILAQQLHSTFINLLSDQAVNVGLVTKNSKPEGNEHILIGTHALLNHQIDQVGLVIIDEQHRFGVQTRQQLTNTGLHTLLMTATPIPRSLAQTLFGHLDLTTLSELPSGRLPVKTYLVPEYKRSDSYTWLKSLINDGNQAFMVTPLIEKAEEQDESPLTSLRELEARLKKTFPKLTIDVMHGKMKDADKLAHMQAFRSGTTHILVATSMIEVGLDIPAANVMIVEDADRFGLATLHQLRGRVGRGGQEGHCLLFSQSSSLKSTERLKYFLRTLDGAKLALYDLKDRGPGELFGDAQHGFFNLKLGSIYDEKLLQLTHEAAKLTLAKQLSPS